MVKSNLRQMRLGHQSDSSLLDIYIIDMISTIADGKMVTDYNTEGKIQEIIDLP